MAERTCVVCDQPLPPRSTPRRVFCSQRCCDIGHSRECEKCGALIWRRGSKGRTDRTMCGRCDPPTPRRPPTPTLKMPQSLRAASAATRKNWSAGTAIEQAKRRSATTESGCWQWTGPVNHRGYPRGGMHRRVLEEALGAPLGSQAAHHKCGNPGCVNPDHLQPVTHAENCAEMHARRALLDRVAELEEALRIADPYHPLLTHIPVR